MTSSSTTSSRIEPALGGGASLPLQLNPMMRITVEVTEPVSAGATPGGEVRVIPFTSGTFTGQDAAGQDVQGHLLPGGTDWQRIRSDGVLEIRAHYLLESDRGERIEVISEGLRHAPAGVLERIMAGEAVEPTEYYFRTAIRFATAAPRLEHLNRVIAISVGKRTQRGVDLQLYAVP